MATIAPGTSTAPAPAIPRLLCISWRNRSIGFAVVVAVAGLAGFIVALIMPRGPITTGQALSVMILGLGVGFGAGLVLRSRWAMLLAPLAHIAVFELGRMGTPGPTVGAIHLDTTYGVLALLLGRGFHGIVGILPMVLGASYGAAFARQFASPPNQRSSIWLRLGLYARRGVAAILAVALVALAGLILRPASTPPMLGADGKPVPGSIAELTEIRLGGHDQWIMIRGASVDKPVLLYLSGGPGQSDLPFIRVMFDNLAQDFVLVDWDQRGTGKSYPALDPAATWTLDQAVSDTVELTNYLRARFGEQKIYLMGESWGTTLGVLAVQRHPELYYAWIGSGQMVSQRETDRMIYADLLDYAARTGDTAMTERLRSYGEPPYQTLLAYAYVMQQYPKIEPPYTRSPAVDELGSKGHLYFWGVLGTEYNLVEKVNVLRGLLDMSSVMYPQLQGIDFRHDVPRLAVPVYILDGQGELRGRRVLAHEWYAQLEAPHKRMYSFEDAGHSAAMEEFQAFHTIMTETVVPETYANQ
ncbi:MAG TPA: alpha/beta fold hydrolase [Herpetosiphonaceae bacterium]